MVFEGNLKHTKLEV